VNRLNPSTAPTDDIDELIIRTMSNRMMVVPLF